MKPFNWTCPHCGNIQTVTEPNYHYSHNHFFFGGPARTAAGLTCVAINCSNESCGLISVNVRVGEDKYTKHDFEPNYDGNILFHERIVPASNAKPQPECIPTALREDYFESCRICDLSPKAAATLARRCIQGMIRDFCGISRATLFQEICELRRLVEDGNAPKGVSDESVEAIDHVRQIGNIGAHMEKDIDLIVPVDPEEANILIELVESLFEEWYVARHKRQQRFDTVKLIAEQKAQLKLAQPARTDDP